MCWKVARIPVYRNHFLICRISSFKFQNCFIEHCIYNILFNSPLGQRFPFTCNLDFELVPYASHKHTSIISILTLHIRFSVHKTHSRQLLQLRSKPLFRRLTLKVFILVTLALCVHNHIHVLL